MCFHINWLSWKGFCLYKVWLPGCPSHPATPPCLITLDLQILYLPFPILTQLIPDWPHHVWPMIVLTPVYKTSISPTLTKSAANSSSVQNVDPCPILGFLALGEPKMLLQCEARFVGLTKCWLVGRGCMRWPPLAAGSRLRASALVTSQQRTHKPFFNLPEGH